MSGKFSEGMPQRYWMTPDEFAQWTANRLRLGKGHSPVKPIVRVKAGRMEQMTEPPRKRFTSHRIRFPIAFDA